MTNTALRFQLVIAGQTVHGVAFESESELDALLAARGLDIAQPTSPADAPVDEPQPRGRPSYSAMLDKAVAAIHLELTGCESLAARSRLVLRHLAQSHAAEDMPAVSTVRAFLAERSIAEKPAEKSADKSKRARIRRTGGL